MATLLKGASAAGSELGSHAQAALVQAARLDLACSSRASAIAMGSAQDELHPRLGSALSPLQRAAGKLAPSAAAAAPGPAPAENAEVSARARRRRLLAIVSGKGQLHPQLTGCKLAELKSQQILAQAAQLGRRIRDGEVAGVLSVWNFKRNNKRLNVMPEGKDFVSSEMLGLVRIRAFSKFIVARSSARYPSVTRLLCQYLYDNPPRGLACGTKFPFTTVCINKDYAAKRHRDNNNMGVSVIRALGDFTGGKLRYWPCDPGPRTAPDVAALRESESVVRTVRGRSVVVDSTKAHEVEPFEGRRFSLVYFTIPKYERSSVAVRAYLSEKCGLELPDRADREEAWRQAMAGAASLRKDRL